MNDYDIKVTVYETGNRYTEPFTGLTVSEFVEFLQEQLKKVPEEYQSKTNIEISSETEYDLSYPTLEISYSRPPTPIEIEERNAKDREYAERQLRQAKENYERLLKSR